MSTPRGVRYLGGGDLSGYGLAALGYVRMLVNAGVPLQWRPLSWTPERMAAADWFGPDGRACQLLAAAGSGAALADVAALVQATSAPVDHDTVVVHAPPEAWPDLFEPGRRNLGCLAWETDRVPAHWLPLLRMADRILVPSRHNREALARSGIGERVAVVPHVRRHTFDAFTPAELDAARAQLGIAPGHRVFYTINTWQPRKALEVLLRAWTRAFDAGAPATLLLKTDAIGTGPGPDYLQRPTRELATAALAAARERAGRPGAPVRVIDRTLPMRELDLLHALGDVYVSTTRGEGWGLGAFEAAMLGRPVLMPDWGGQVDFLGEDGPGALPWRLAPVPLWPPSKPSYFPSQRWAEVDEDAVVERLRAALEDPSPFLERARAVREHVVERHGEPRVVHDWLAAWHG